MVVLENLTYFKNTHTATQHAPTRIWPHSLDCCETAATVPILSPAFSNLTNSIKCHLPRRPGVITMRVNCIIESRPFLRQESRLCSSADGYGAALLTATVELCWRLRCSSADTFDTALLTPTVQLCWRLLCSSAYVSGTALLTPMIQLCVTPSVQLCWHGVARLTPTVSLCWRPRCSSAGAYGRALLTPTVQLCWHLWCSSADAYGTALLTRLRASLAGLLHLRVVVSAQRMRAREREMCFEICLGRLEHSDRSHDSKRTLVRALEEFGLYLRSSWLLLWLVKFLMVIWLHA